jgi:O-antigen/teichoic acid export membrane protein
MSNKSIFARFSASALRVLLARIVAFIAVFGFNAVLARSLEPTDFGLFALLFSFATLTSLLASCGMNRALVKVLAEDSSQDSDTVWKIVNLGLMTSVTAGILVGGSAFIICSQLMPGHDEAERFAISGLFGGIVLIRNIHFVLAETTRGFHETNWSNLFGGAAGGPAPHLMFLIALIAVWSTQETTSLTIVLAVYLACFAITLPPLALKLCSLCMIGVDSPSKLKSVPVSDDLGTPKPKFSVQTIWLLAIPMMLTQSFGVTLSQADVWLAGALVLPTSVAIYCSAQRMLAALTVPLQISGTAIVSFVPELVAKNKIKQLQEMVGLATFVSGVPGILIGTALLLFPEAILSFVFGEFYAQAAFILRILVAGQLICILSGPGEIVLAMAGHQNKTLAVNAICAVAIFTFGPLGIYFGGVGGLAMAMCGALMIQSLANWWLAKELVGVWTHFDVGYVPKVISHVTIMIRKRSFDAV